MNSAELKLKIFRQLDLLDEKKLEEAYGVLLNYFNKQDNSDEWNKLSKKQQEGIREALVQLDNGKGIPHKKVMSKLRKKYNA